MLVIFADRLKVSPFGNVKNIDFQVGAPCPGTQKSGFPAEPALA